MVETKVVPFCIRSRNHGNSQVEVIFAPLSDDLNGLPFTPSICVVLSEDQERRFYQQLGAVVVTKLGLDGEIAKFGPGPGSQEFSEAQELLRAQIEQSPPGAFHLQLVVDPDARQLLGFVTMK